MTDPETQELISLQSQLVQQEAATAKLKKQLWTVRTVFLIVVFVAGILSAYRVGFNQGQKNLVVNIPVPWYALQPPQVEGGNK